MFNLILWALWCLVLLKYGVIWFLVSVLVFVCARLVVLECLIIWSAYKLARDYDDLEYVHVVRELKRGLVRGY